ncbi:serine/threonine protein kinase [Tokyovirus A1]|uniref:serine/threonine protein kinase n=1 Tax=Tokyovirus A1 TaxID=1826170 RepID=UPI0007A9721B|nr:serine/threonine protein kinase [Tokyovirus A1]BAU79936.1 serine/threonine protein kinase [Tokyovirus A1]
MSFRSCIASDLFAKGRDGSYENATREFVARGCSGGVYKCTKGKRVFAEKVMRCRPNGEEDEILREFDVMCLAWRADAELFPRPLFLEFDREEETAVIGMEWFDGEPLQNLEDKSVVEKKLFWAAKALNTVGVFHADLNLANILVSKDGKRIKVIDFGSTTMMEEEAVIFDPSDYVSGSEEEERELDEQEAKTYQLFEFFRLFATSENMELFVRGNKKWTEILQLFDRETLEQMLD